MFESLEVKHEVFRELDRICRDGAVLATNTSAIPITQIAAVTRRPESVVGTHFFSPVPMMALCELVRGYKTSDETLAAARAFAESVGKTCVVVNRDVAGFVTTRLICALAMEAVRLVESGVASAEDIDTACRLGFGHAMGPLATTDLTGVDILRNATLNIYDGDRRREVLPARVADPDGRRRRPRPQVRPGLLHLRRLTDRRPRRRPPLGGPAVDHVWQAAALCEVSAPRKCRFACHTWSTGGRADVSGRARACRRTATRPAPEPISHSSHRSHGVTAWRQEFLKPALYRRGQRRSTGDGNFAVGPRAS